MLQLLMRWFLRGALALAVTFVCLYVGDLTVYHLRGMPQSRVTVNSYVPIPLKGNKTEFDYLGEQDQPCSISLFSQGDLSPCWRLKRNRNPGLSM